MLAAKANGEKMKTNIVFAGSKREVQNLKKDHEKLSKRLLLAWDSYRAHLTDEVKELFSKGKIDTSYYPWLQIYRRTNLCQTDSMTFMMNGWIKDPIALPKQETCVALPLN